MCFLDPLLCRGSVSVWRPPAGPRHLATRGQTRDKIDVVTATRVWESHSDLGKNTGQLARESSRQIPNIPNCFCFLIDPWPGEQNIEKGVKINPIIN